MDLLTFDALPASLQQAISMRELKPGQRLFRQGDAATALFILEAGRLRLVRSTIDSKVIPLQFVHPGQLVGDAALFAGMYAQTAIAEIASRVIVYPTQELTTALREHPDLTGDIIAKLLQKISLLEVNLELKGIRSAPQRVLRYLQYLAVPGQANIIHLDRPWKEIADELGFTPDTLSRTLAKLEREGTISRTQATIKLNDSSVA